mgnify:CR=1 FL=1
MEDNISYAIRPLRVQGNAIWTHQCSSCFSTYDKWYISRISWWLCRYLPWWHSCLLVEHGRAYSPRSINSLQTQGAWTLCQERKMWVWSQFHRISWLCYLTPGHHHGSKENQDYPRMGQSKMSKGCPIVPWFWEFLLAIYQGVLHHSITLDWAYS